MTARWHEPVDTRRIPLAALLAALLAFGANAGIREVGRRWLDASPQDPLLSLIAIGVATSAAAVCASVTLAVLAASQARPFTIFRVTAVIVLVASCALPIMARAGWFTGGQAADTAAMTTMLLMHVVTAAALVFLLTTLPRARLPQRF